MGQGQRANRRKRRLGYGRFRIGMPVRVLRGYRTGALGVVQAFWDGAGRYSTPLVVVRFGPEPPSLDEMMGTDAFPLTDVEPTLEVLRGGKGQMEKQEEAL